MKKIKFFVFAILLTFLLSINVYADKIYKISMDIYVDENGNANISEIWDVKASGGSEWYKQLYNLGNEEVSNFKVSMDGTPLEQKVWDIDESLSQKSGYYGINYVSEGLELCFGKKDMERHTFKLTYDLSNFVFNAEDSQIIYQTLLPKVSLDSFEVVVRSFYEFPDTLDVWGYGYGGTKNNIGYAYVENGVIKMSNEEGSYLNDEYVVLLAKFPKDTFKTANSTSFNTFDDVYNKAEEGSFKYNYEGSKFSKIISAIISFITSFFVPFLIIIAAIFSVKNATKYGTKKIKFEKGANKVKDAPYFREIPCNKDIFRGYWYACQYNLVKKQTDFLGAVLLKWLKNGNVENITVTSKILKKEERAIKLVNSNNLNELEQDLFTMMSSASGDGVLEKNEFKKWCKKNYSKIFKWFNKAVDDETMKLVGEGFITEEKKMFSSIYHIDDKLKENAMQVAGLKNFLNEFSNIKDRESIEVKLWEEYLMFAQIFGIAEKVAKEFKNLYPDVITDEYYDDFVFIHTMSYEGVSAASAARTAAQSYSSGGGGFSSGGGGGGSFGGGGSMGGR